MKLGNFYIESKGEKFLTNDIIVEFKELWKSSGKMIKDIKSLNIYFNTEENCAYCIVNDSETIKIQK